MSLAAKIVLALALFTSGVWTGVKFHAGLVAERDLKANEEQQRASFLKREKQDYASVGHEKDKARIQTRYITITKEVERVVKDDFYAGACLNDDGLRVLRAAVAGQAPSEPANAVPGPAKP